MVKIVLSNTSHQGNIGAAARAVKSMGFSNILLVNPKNAPNEEAYARATHAKDLLENCVVNDLNTALSGVSLVIGTTARARDLNLPVIHPRKLKEVSQKQENIAILFGNERTGLTNEELKHCNILVHIPTNSECSSLNLAAAIQIITYELSQITIQETRPKLLAEHEEVQNFYKHLQEIINMTDFIKDTSSTKLMLKLQCLFQRAAPTKTEIAILRGILTSIAKKL